MDPCAGPATRWGRGGARCRARVDVLLCAHTGLDHLATVGDIWRNCRWTRGLTCAGGVYPAHIPSDPDGISVALRGGPASMRGSVRTSRARRHRVAGDVTTRAALGGFLGARSSRCGQKGASVRSQERGRGASVALGGISGGSQRLGSAAASSSRRSGHSTRGVVHHVVGQVLRREIRQRGVPATGWDEQPGLCGGRQGRWSSFWQGGSEVIDQPRRPHPADRISPLHSGVGKGLTCQPGDCVEVDDADDKGP